MFIIDADWIPIVGQSLWDNWNVHINAKMSYAFFQIKLENSLYKISEYKSQAKKKMILIVISLFSHFWSPVLTNFW